MSIANLLTTPFFKLLPYKRHTTHFCVHKGLTIQEDKPKDNQQQERQFQVDTPTRKPNTPTPPNPVAYSHINWSLVFIFLVFASLKLTHK
jgi:hypothetical protein